MKTNTPSSSDSLGSASQRVTPVLTLPDIHTALDFYRRAFDAVEVMRLTGDNKFVIHAEVELFGARIVLTSDSNSYGTAPYALRGSTVVIHIYVTDADQVVAQAIASGAHQIAPVTDKFYGERSAILKDPFGHIWNVATLQQKLSAEEIQQRWNELTRPRLPSR